MSLRRIFSNPQSLLSRSVLSAFPKTKWAPQQEEGHRVVEAGIALSLYGDNAVISSKYNWYNMLPKAVFDQFRRVSNFYFLIVAAISFIPNISPSSPITTTLPLLVVIGFGLARDLYEDFQRKRADAKSNNHSVIIHKRSSATSSKLQHPRTLTDNDCLNFLASSKLAKSDYNIIRSRDIAVGDIIVLRDGVHIPADAVVLHSAHASGECFVSTANLDGESNLKRRVALPGGRDEPLAATVTMSAPNPSLYQIEGTLSRPCSSVSYPLDDRNLLLRGAVIRNTPYVHALAVYTGSDTKLALNMRNPPSKLGGVERTMNKVVIALFGALILLTVITAVVAGLWQSSRGSDQWYMGDNRLLSGTTVGLRSLGTFIILYHTFVPVSLFVTLEFVRLVQGVFISADPAMRTNGEGPDVRANNLNETLGYVDHIFSDKTGTLTQNVMRFAAGIVPGVGRLNVRKEPYSFRNAVSKFTEARRFATAMAIAHDVIPAHVPGKPEIEYQGESPDEVALLDGAREAGVALMKRVEHKLFVNNAFGAHNDSSKEAAYEVLAILEFNSDRKRMSVVALCPDEKVRIFTKGADSTMMPLLSSSSERLSARRASDELSKEGLRTLVYASRVVDEDELGPWLRDFHDAVNAMEGRLKKKERVYAAIEYGLHLLGVTGVEDKLQDEVPEAIVFLREAGIRIWVLTGDKVETAENIGYSSLLLSRDMNVAIATCETEKEVEKILTDFAADMGVNGMAVGLGKDGNGTSKAKRLCCFGDTKDSSRAKVTETDGNHALIIDGNTLSLLTSPEVERLFVDVSLRCKTVICARVTPLQKAEMVKVVRKYVKSNTLAIGDGGNDVSMIQEADIGVGIKGKEGAQAARAADYAMGEFRHLKRLLAVHGRYSYVRTSGTINLSFYKNVFFSCTQFIFQFFCFASGTTLHDQWIVTSWNAIVTLLPPFMYGIFERDLEVDTVLRFPVVYGSNRGNKLFSLRTVAEYTLAYGVWHALTVFWATYWFFGEWNRTVFPSGHDAGFFLTGLGISIMAVCIALSKFLLSSHLWNLFVIGSTLFSFSLLWLLIYLFPVALHEYPLEGVLPKLMSSPTYHLLWPLVFVTAFIPDFLIRLRRTGRNNLVACLQAMEVRNQNKRKTDTSVHDASL